MFWTDDRLSGLMSFLDAKPSIPNMDVLGVNEGPERAEAMASFFAETIGLPFSETLLRMIDVRGMTDVAVYKAAKIDRRVFSKIRSNAMYQPSKKTAVRLCLALRCTPSEAMTLLEKAGLCLSRSKKEDMVILYCLRNEIYDVDVVNDVMVRLKLEEIF